jgi:glycosyltransferase involved in cell wall biosynthesis
MLEAKMCGKPIISIKTGGLTRQVEDHITGFQYGIGLDPDARSLVGNQMVPYIYEDFITHESLSNAFMKMYDMGPDERKKLGEKSREHANRDYDLDKMVSDWDKSLEGLIDGWKTSPARRWAHIEV